MWRPIWQYIPIKPFFANSMVNLLVIFSNSLSCKGKSENKTNNEKNLIENPPVETEQLYHIFYL